MVQCAGRDFGVVVLICGVIPAYGLPVVGADYAQSNPTVTKSAPASFFEGQEVWEGLGLPLLIINY
jgi:hypothetical protein